MEDWDLQAVVRGCSTSESVANIINKPTASLFAPLSFDQDELSVFPEIFQTDTNNSDVVGDFPKSFYPTLHQTLFPQALLSTASSIFFVNQVKQPQMVQILLEDGPLSGYVTSPVSSDFDTVRAAKMKKRKNQHKKVVQKVITDNGISSDKWAWRKYGQKPIKGSPYPRSYYRCSSSKGCLARKQAERSSSDPSAFIITYTGEHNHTQPTCRNSLSRYLSKGIKTINEADMEKTTNERSQNNDTFPSSSVASMASTLEEQVQ